MARDKPIDRSPKVISVDSARQILPGSVEYVLCYLLDPEMDLSAFDQRHRNDEGGASAYAPPALLLKIIRLAYSRGLESARVIESACPQNVLFMAVCGGATPPWPTLAVVSSGGDALSPLVTQGLVVWDRQGRIGRELFAIDGVKLPSKAAKARSGTRKEFQREAKPMARGVQRLLARHRREDLSHTCEPALRPREARQVERLQHEAAKIRDWPRAHPDDRRGVRGAIRKSNRTDNESAKMATGKGVRQGDTGVAVVDEQPQILVHAQAHGVGQEQELRGPAVEAIQPLGTEATIITADAGYHSEANLQALAEQGIDAYLPDNGSRKRDPRYAGQEQHRGKQEPV